MGIERSCSIESSYSSDSFLDRCDKDNLPQSRSSGERAYSETQRFTAQEIKPQQFRDQKTLGVASLPPKSSINKIAFMCSLVGIGLIVASAVLGGSNPLKLDFVFLDICGLGLYAIGRAYKIADNVERSERIVLNPDCEEAQWSAVRKFVTKWIF